MTDMIEKNAAAALSALPPLPLGLTEFADFEKTRAPLLIKADALNALTRWCGTWFLSRPPHFGKTSLLSILETLFSRGPQCSPLLQSVTTGPWMERRFKVIRLDFAKICAPDTASVSALTPAAAPGNFAGRFVRTILETFARAGVIVTKTWPEGTDRSVSWFFELQDALQKQPGISLVLLIDNVDAPLTAAGLTAAELKERRNLLEDFFMLQKSCESKFRFTLLTGLHPLGLSTEFGPVDHIDDCTFDLPLGALTGITQQELETCLRPYISAAAHRLNEMQQSDRWTEQSVLEAIKEHLSGYCFDSYGRSRVYCPQDVFCFLQKPEDGFKSCPAVDCKALPELISLFARQKARHDGSTEQEALSALTAPDSALCEIDDASLEMAPAPEPCRVDALSCLYRLGILTIKKAERFEMGGGMLYLAAANNAVRTALAALTADKNPAG